MFFHWSKTSIADNVRSKTISHLHLNEKPRREIIGRKWRGCSFQWSLASSSSLWGMDSKDLVCLRIRQINCNEHYYHFAWCTASLNDVIDNKTCIHASRSQGTKRNETNLAEPRLYLQYRRGSARLIVDVDSQCCVALALKVHVWLMTLLVTKPVFRSCLIFPVMSIFTATPLQCSNTQQPWMLELGHQVSRGMGTILTLVLFVSVHTGLSTLIVSPPY